MEETILSVLNQNYPNLEYIIIDGGSTDGTVDIIKRYEDRLAYWISEPDNGMYDALQKGFDRSTGEIMGWLNADDMYFKGALHHIANIFLNHVQINWLTGSNTHIDEDGDVLLNIPSRKLNKYQFLTGDYMWIAQESTLWRRGLWEKAGSHLRTDLTAAGDFELWLRFIQIDTLYYVRNCIGMFRHREGQISGELDKYIEEVNSIYASFKIKPEDRNVINKYRKKQRIANIINMTRILNGNKFVRLKTFEKKYLSTPPFLTWFDDIKGYNFSSEE